MLEQTHKQALRIADLLRQRGEKVAVADGATGGLVAASLLLKKVPPGRQRLSHT